MYQTGWFSTGRGPGSRSLLKVVWDSIQKGDLNVSIPFVFTNREPGEGEGSDLFINQVKEYAIPLIYFSSQQFASKNAKRLSLEWRLEYDREIIKRLTNFQPDLIVLAGYMLIVGSELCQKYTMINLHPAQPGGLKGMWQDIIWKLIEERRPRGGIMMHLVIPELDAGPAVTYCTYPIKGRQFDVYWKELEHASLEKIRKEQGENYPLFKLIRQHGLAREMPLIITTIKAFSEGIVRVDRANKMVVDGQGKVISAYDLSEEINRILPLELRAP